MAEELEILKSDRVTKLKQQIENSDNEVERLKFINQLFKIIQSSSESIVDKMDDGVTIDNFDEVKAALANEFKRNTKTLTAAIKDLKLSNEEQSKLTAGVNKNAIDSLESEFQTVRIKKPRDRVIVKNFDDIVFPDTVSINNLGDIISSLNELKEAFAIDIPVPQVTIEPTPINIPEQNITIPESNFDPIIDAINDLRKGLKSNINSSNNRAFSKLIDTLNQRFEELATVNSQAFGAFPGTVGLSSNAKVSIKSPKGVVSGTLAMTGSAVRISTSKITCKHIIVNADLGSADPMVAGGSNVSSTNEAQVGIILIPGNNPTKIEINDISQLYFDGTSGDDLAYAYFT